MRKSNINPHNDYPYFFENDIEMPYVGRRNNKWSRHVNSDECMIVRYKAGKNLQCMALFLSIPMAIDYAIECSTEDKNSRFYVVKSLFRNRATFQLSYFQNGRLIIDNADWIVPGYEYQKCIVWHVNKDGENVHRFADDGRNTFGIVCMDGDIRKASYIARKLSEDNSFTDNGQGLFIVTYGINDNKYVPAWGFYEGIKFSIIDLINVFGISGV